MNTNIHTHLTQLRIICHFKEGQKGRIENGYLTVCDNSFINWVRRQMWILPWSGEVDSRDNTVSFLINFYTSVMQLTNELIKSDCDENMDIMKKLRNNISASIEGLNNLANTYKYYVPYKARIQGIIEDYANPAIKLLDNKLAAVDYTYETGNLPDTSTAHGAHTAHANTDEE